MIGTSSNLTVLLADDGEEIAEEFVGVDDGQENEGISGWIVCLYRHEKAPT